MGSGLLIFSPGHYRLEEMFAEDREIILFTTKEESSQKVIYYKEHDSKRRTVAQAGWQKVATHYNERLVAQYILEQTFRMKLTEPYARPTRDILTYETHHSCDHYREILRQSPACASLP